MFVFVHALTFMVLLLIGWVIWNNKPLQLPFIYFPNKDLYGKCMRLSWTFTHFTWWLRFVWLHRLFWLFWFWTGDVFVQNAFGFCTQFWKLFGSFSPTLFASFTPAFLHNLLATSFPFSVNFFVTPDVYLQWILKSYQKYLCISACIVCTARIVYSWDRLNDLSFIYSRHYIFGIVFCQTFFEVTFHQQRNRTFRSEPFLCEPFRSRNVSVLIGSVSTHFGQNMTSCRSHWCYSNF